MSIASIICTVDCDECGNQFRVSLDPAYTPPSGRSLFDAAVDAVRGGHIMGASLFDGSSSVQGGKMLCIPCTDAADAQDESA